MQNFEINSKITNNIHYTPVEAEIIEFIEELPDVFTIKLQITDPEIAKNYTFLPGQFNMVYLYGVGEVAISIVYGCVEQPGSFMHTIAVVGRITKGMVKLKKGDKVGIRGPFGTSWPLQRALGKNVIIVSGGVGNAPLVAATEYILKNRENYGKLYIIHGIRNSEMLFYDSMYQRWNNSINTVVMMSTSHSDPLEKGNWLWKKGYVTDFIPDLEVDLSNSVLFTVGPEVMMKLVATEFIKAGMNKEDIYLSLERSMKCAIGHCGHCQLSEQFICKDGPVYSYSKCERLLSIKGL